MAELEALSDGFSAILKKSQEVSEPAYQKMQAAEEEYAKTKGDLGVKAAELKAKSARGSAGGQLAVYDKYEKELMAPAPTIQYSADTADGMKNLAVLLPIAGMMMGGAGQLSGVGALKAMSGVLEGHKQGNQDRIALEQKNFEQQMQNWKLHQEQIKGAFERALQRAKISASAAQSGLQVDLAKLDAQLLLADVKKNGIIDPLKRFNAMNEKVTTAIEGAVTKMYTSPTKTSQMTDDAANFVADSYLDNPAAAAPLFSRLSAPDKEKVLALAAQKAKDKNISPEDLDKKRLQLIADTSAARTFGTQEARVGAAAQTASNSISIAKDYSERLPRGTFQTFNSFVQKGLSEISDPDLLGFRKALDTLSIEYARATTPTGQPTDYKLKIAQNALSTVTSKEAFDEVISVMEREIAASQKAQQQGLENILGGKKIPSAAAPAAPSGKPTPTASDIAYAKAHPEVKEKFIQKFGVEP